MRWEPEVEEIKRRVELAKQMGGEANVARHHANGRLTVRERITRLLDSDSFHEVGALAGRATYENGELATFTPSNFVLGTGRIDGRKVVVGGDDFTVRGGAVDGAVSYKAVYAERLAREFRVPMYKAITVTYNRFLSLVTNEHSLVRKVFSSQAIASIAVASRVLRRQAPPCNRLREPV